MPNAFDNAGVFLISALFDLYLFVLMIRLILVWARADYFNPLSQFILKLTNPIIIPFRRILPTFLNIELSTLVLILLLEVVKFFLLGYLTMGAVNIVGLFILAIADASKILFTTLFYAILLQALLSWIQPGYSPVAKILMQVTEPIMRPIRRIIPPIGGFDISPIPALIILQLLVILISNPLFNLGLKTAFG